MTHALTIGIDARAAVHPQAGGFKTYVANLVETLAEVDRRNEYRLYLDRPGLRSIVARNPRFRTQVVSARPSHIGPLLREQVWLPVAELLHPSDVVHFPCATAPVWSPAPMVVTIHDALEHMPLSEADRSGGLKRRLMRRYSRYNQRVAARRAAAIITVSECSRRDLVEYLGVDQDRVTVVPEAPGRLFRAMGIAREAEAPFILALGSHDPRKNLSLLIRAYAALPPGLIERFRLVLVWTHTGLRRELLSLARQQGVEERIDSVVAPVDEELNRLYNSSTVFVFPSLYEGFGLPPIEAMACGTPVIASNTSSLPEVLGDAALLVDPAAEGELTAALTRALTEPAVRACLSRRGRARAEQFSWARTAGQTLAVYEAVAAETRGRSLARARGACASA